jgi:hypothetical protein
VIVVFMFSVVVKLVFRDLVSLSFALLSRDTVYVIVALL